MTAKVFMALFAAMLIVIQPAFAEGGGVIVIDLGYATEEELAGALDAATELELIMRAEWELYDEDGAAPAAEAEETGLYEAEPIPVAEVEEPVYVAEEAIAAEAEEPVYVAEEPAPAIEVEEPVYIAEEPAVEAEEPVYVVEEPVPAVEAEEPVYIAEEPAVEVEEPVYVAEDVPEGIRDNVYFLESLRLVRLAEEAYEQGDYEAAAIYAQEATRYAQLSDVYIAQQMGTEEAVAVAADDGYPLPATFTVRSWATYRDCLWNIAALPEVYGDPLRWPVLFNANRHRMPNPNNPDLILPGMVLEIPSIDGEIREGAWQSGRVYRR